jgi:hypothetical protein
MVPPYHGTYGFWLDTQILQGCTEFTIKDEMIHFMVAPAGEFFHERFGGMGIRTMPDVVEKSSNCDEVFIIFGNAKMMAEEPGKMHCPERMLKTGMVCTWIDQMGESQLPDISEPLDGRRVQQGENPCIHLNVPVNGIFDDFHRFLVKESTYIG